MLKKKEYSEILQKAMSRIQVVQFFQKLYTPTPVIRMTKKEYQAAGRYDITMSCDKCGKTFLKKCNTNSSNIEFTREEAACPHCGFSFCYTTTDYRKQEIEHFYTDEAYDNYSKVYTGSEFVQPTIALFEEVKVEEKVYSVIRRFNFELTEGDVSSIRMVRCLIIPDNEVDNYALLYENSVGDIAVSRSELPQDWFTHSDYREPGFTNLHYFGRFVKEAEDAENPQSKKSVMADLMKSLRKSMDYYSREAITVRTVLDKYKVSDIPTNAKPGTAYAENHGTYIVLRKFTDVMGVNYERERFIYSLEDRYIVYLMSKNGIWQEFALDSYGGLTDDDFTDCEEVLKKTFVGKLGLYRYLEEKDRGNYYRTCHAVHYLQNLIKHPIIEKLLKVGFVQLIDSVISNKINLNYHGNSLWQMLRLSKANYSLALEEKLHTDEFIRLQAINAFDEEVDRETFLKCCGQYKEMSTYEMRLIAEQTGLRLKDMVDYVEKLYYEQGIECSEGTTLWKDYLNMFKQYYKRNVKGAAELYPDSLKREHDVLSMRSNKWAYKNNAVFACFANINEQWKKLEYDDKHFEIILPKNSREVVLEGQSLCHCVASYVQDIVDGNCLILFIRRKECEEKSFFTMEFDMQNSVRQIKGHSNRTLKDLAEGNPELFKSLAGFLSKWGKKNHIMLNIPTVEKSVENVA